MPARRGPRADQIDQGSASQGQIITAGLLFPSFEDNQGGGGGGSGIDPANILLGGAPVTVDLTAVGPTVIVPAGTNAYIVTRIIIRITNGGATTDAMISAGTDTAFEDFVLPVDLTNTRVTGDVYQISMTDKTQVLETDLTLDVLVAATGGALTAEVYVHGFNV